MRLRGTKTEKDIREELIISHKSLFQDRSRHRLLNILIKYFPNMKTAYILGWTPDQDEDFYTILINIDQITIIEVDRYEILKPPIITTMTIKDYNYKLSKINQIKLAVAIDLAKNDMKL